MGKPSSDARKPSRVPCRPLPTMMKAIPSSSAQVLVMAVTIDIWGSYPAFLRGTRGFRALPLHAPERDRSPRAQSRPRAGRLKAARSARPDLRDRLHPGTGGRLQAEPGAPGQRGAACYPRSRSRERLGGVSRWARRWWWLAPATAPASWWRGCAQRGHRGPIRVVGGRSVRALPAPALVEDLLERGGRGGADAAAPRLRSTVRTTSN